MHLTYTKYDFTLKFASPILFDVYPLFVIRSVLGDKLRSICCMAKNVLCPDCIFNKTCAYSWIFETILDKENESVPGRDRGSHPYFISFPKNGSINFQEKTDTFSFTLTLIGKANEYFPYIFEALKRAGKSGLLKGRIQYKIESVFAFEEKLTDEEENLIKKAEQKDFSMEINAKSKSNQTFLINLKSPFRLLVEKKVMKTFTSNQFFFSALRRIRSLCSMYGEINESDLERPVFCENSVSDENFTFLDLERWSSRQKKTMKIGGIFGNCKISGEISDVEEKLFEVAELFGIGKNNSLGLGQVFVQKA